MKGKFSRVTLGKIAEIVSGGTPSRTQHRYWNGTIPWVKTTQIQNSFINQSDIDEYITEEGLQNSSARIIPSGTILMAMYGQGKTRGQVSILNCEATINQACAAIQLSKEVSRDFIFQNLLLNYNHIRNMSNTGSQENLNASLVKEIPIHLPPLAEQKAIADLLSTWDTAIEKTEQLIQAKEKHFKGLMQRLLKEQPHWKNVKLYEASKVIVSNVDKKSSLGEEPVKLCNYMDVYKNYYITHDIDFMEATATRSEIEKYELKSGDVLLTKDSETPDDIANSACVIIEPKNLLCGYHLAILRPDKSLQGAYLNFVLHLPKTRYQFSRQANGATRFGLGLSAYSKIEIPLPPLDEQKQIADTLTTAQREIDLLKEIKEKYVLKKRGLMQRLLTGEWRITSDVVAQYEEAV